LPEAPFKFWLRRASRADWRDVVGNPEQRGVVGQSASESGVFLRRGWAKDGLGQLSVALVAAGGQFAVEAASA
jgi:hypothetical protein